MSKNGKSKLSSLSMAELLEVWSKSLKEAYIVVDGKIVEGKKSVQRMMEKVDAEIIRREGGVKGFRYTAGFHRKEYNIKKEKRGWGGKHWRGGELLVR